MNLRQVDLINLYRVWKSNLGVFRCFFRSTAFVSLKTYNDFAIYKYKNEVHDYVVRAILECYRDDYFTIIDLDLDEILDLAVCLNNENNIKPILNLNLLFNDFGIIGNKKNISKLINCGLKLKKIKDPKYVMMIPFDRYREDIDASKEYDKLNNQYGISEEDLPDAEFLKELGYKGITIVTKDKIKDDIKDYIKLINKDIEVNIVRLGNNEGF